MTNELMRDFNVGGAVLGSLSAFYFYAYASLQLPVGILTDRFGPRKLMSTAAFLCAIASVIFSQSESLLVASISRGMIGATVAFGFVGTLAIIGYWFKPSQYATFVGVAQAAGMAGGIFGQAPLRVVVESTGWRSTMVILAAISLVLAILIFLLVPKRSQTQKQIESRPSIVEGLRSVSSNRQTWLCALIGFGMVSTMLGFGGLWAVPWLSNVHGYTTKEAAGIASILFVAWAIFSPVVGWASDRIGRRNPIMIVGATICLIAFSLTIFFTPDNTTLLVILVFLTGAGGCTMSIGFTVVKELNDENFNSTSQGLMNMFVVGSGAVMQPLIGWLLDRNWTGTIQNGARIYSEQAYTAALSSLVLVTAVALVGTLLLKESFCKQVRLKQ